MKFSVLLSSAFFLFLFLFSSCSKDPISIGDEIVGSDKKLESATFHNFSIYSIDLGSIEAANGDSCILGHLNDTVTGNRKAELLIEMIAENHLSDSANIDSIVLYLAYTGKVGNTSTTPTVHLVNSSFPEDSKSDFDPAGLTTKEISLSSFIDDNNMQQLSIPLDSSDLIPYLTEGELLPLFIQYRDEPGLGDGALYTIDFFSEKSHLTVYYKNNSGESDSLFYKIRMSSKRYSLFSNDYSTSRINDVLNDTIQTHNTGYIQGMAGPRLLVEINKNTIKEIAGYKKINQAILSIPLKSNANTSPLSFLMANTTLLEGQEVIIADAPVFTSESYSKGHLTDGVYKFNITMHINNVIENHASNQLFFYPVIKIEKRYYYNFVTSKTSVIDGSGIKLDIVYSNIK
jgi:hypothetical protein